MINPFAGIGDLKPGPDIKKEEAIKEEAAKIIREETYVEKILKEHKGLESNIPINHPYWKVR